jgi:hypothetical protein
MLCPGLQTAEEDHTVIGRIHAALAVAPAAAAEALPARPTSRCRRWSGPRSAAR